MAQPSRHHTTDRLALGPLVGVCAGGAGGHHGGRTRTAGQVRLDVTPLRYRAGMVRFLHTADWQLGMTRHFLGAEAQPRFAAARISAIRSIGALAVDERCEFVVVGGDVFETNQVDRQVVRRALDAMAASPGVHFYLLPGNHDPLDASSVFRSPTFERYCPANVSVIVDSTPISVRPGVEVVGAPWSSKRPLEDLVAAAITSLPADGTIRVVVGHGAVDTLSPDPTNPALINVSDLEANLDAGRVHFVALGDRHSTTDIGASGRVWYAGAPEPTDFRETDPGQVLVVEVDADDVSVATHQIGTWTFLRHEADLTGSDDLDLLDGWLQALPHKDRTIVRLAMVGQLSLAERARLEELLDHHRDLLASLEGWERRIDLVVLPDDADFSGLELSGFAHDALEDLRALAEAGPDASTAQDALGLLFRLARPAS